MVVTRDFELQYIETKEVPKIRGIDMDCGITTACFVKIHGISDVKEMESFMPTDTIWPIEVAGDLDKSDGGAKIQSHEGWFMILVEFVIDRRPV
ncbi:hypothetical protein Bca4012_044482 [Brassica carinata]|uniref:Uncharacterized protein n=1 Tax=Brassica carinata TaxID=52824 RepID=A0A8X7QX33_BRACI|nr:hypothetical protein Bca52824_058018 [Brassica carinata]